MDLVLSLVFLGEIFRDIGSLFVMSPPAFAMPFPRVRLGLSHQYRLSDVFKSEAVPTMPINGPPPFPVRWELSHYARPFLPGLLILIL